MSVIEATGLTKRYPRVVALDGLDLSVGDGVTGLIGANGTGKSTFIKILLGLLPATSGDARVLGYDVVSQGAKIRGSVGYMPEHDCLPADVSANDFVVHMAQMSGLPRTASRKRTADVLRHVGLAEERYRVIGGYSTGMKQRAKLAQALVHDPALVLLDEPTNGLDPTARDDMLEVVGKIGADFGISVLVTSHLLGELERITDHVVVLDGGRMLRSSATSDLTKETGMLLVEVSGGRADRDQMLQALTGVGLVAKPEGDLVQVETADPAAYDVIRDRAADLDLGLVRVQQHHRRIADVFEEEEDERVPAV
jgi:ABC-2 type transport system ATP-binding protein